jgi:hypothetical protein
MDPLLANIDLNSNPYAGTEHDTNKSLRDFALERIMARRENRSQLAQIAWDMRRAVGPDGFHPELRKAVQAFIKFDVESAGGRPSARAFFQEARDLLLYASSPQTILETPAKASERRNAAAIQARIAQAAGVILNDNRELTTDTFPRNRSIYHHASVALKSTDDMGDSPSCGACRAIMTLSGSCYRCMSCGSTSGCS